MLASLNIAGIAEKLLSEFKEALKLLYLKINLLTIFDEEPDSSQRSAMYWPEDNLPEVTGTK